VFGSRTWGAPSRFIAEIPQELTDREEQRPSLAGIRARAMSWDGGGASGAGGGSAGRGNSREPAWSREQPPPATFRLGEDVSHPTFGEGVVTGIEPGGIVVIRFAKDRAERKLVADLAPITKR
jgi:DNA helicase-2/ATP-dependent DNA helicase PcrA